MGSSSGPAAQHSSVARKQRGAKAQPGGRWARSGGRPAIVCSVSRRGSLRRGTLLSSPTVYGWCGRAKSGLAGPLSTMRPAYMTRMRRHMPATTPRSWVITMTAASCSRESVLSRRRICAWMVTSSAVVGSSASSSLGLHERAMAIMTRWRMPPLNWCG